MHTEVNCGITSRNYFSQRLRLHYVDWGNPDAPPLILLHGGLDHCRNWDWVAKELRSEYHILAPDLRGHGDSQWSSDGNYSITSHVYDLAQLIHQLKLAPVRIVAHSLGANIALRYAGVFPHYVVKLVAIEGLSAPPRLEAEFFSQPADVRLRRWVDQLRVLSGRSPRRYGSIEEALARMQEENRHLTPTQARHLTIHGITQNEDGSYSWKFDNYVRSRSPADMTPEELRYLWSRIECPTLLVQGAESWAPDPVENGLAACFRDAKVAVFENAGHWVHHDRLEAFVNAARTFL